MRFLTPFIFAMLLLIDPLAAAEPAHVFIIDPGHTITGARVARWASELPKTKVTTLDYAQLRKSPPAQQSTIVWISPIPGLFDRDVALFWSARTKPDAGGLMIIGLEDGDADANWMTDTLRPRIDAVPGNLLAKYMSGANWIWTDKPRDGSEVVFERTFDLDDVPTRAWMQIAADNSATVWVNDVRIGENTFWRRPASLDASKAVRKGRNVIRISAFNEDGPAGVVAAIQGRAADGSEMFRIVTDATWQAQEQVKAPAEAAPFAPAKVVAPLAGGPWENKVETSYGAEVYALRPTGESAIVADLKDPIGNCTVLRSLTPRGGSVALLKADDMPVAVAGERTVIFASDPEKTTGADSVLNSESFAKFVRRSIAYVGGRDPARADDITVATTQAAERSPLDRTAFFPVTMQLSPIPHEGARLAKALPDSVEGLQHLIDEMVDHGITALQCPLPLPDTLSREVEQYAQSRGMGITYVIEHGIEGFGRDKPPAMSLYSQAYRDALAKRVHSALALLERYPNAINVFAAQDEPFHGGVHSFGNSPEERAEFRKRFGRDLPVDTMGVRNDPRQWLDLINFHSDYFPVGWRELYRLCKAAHPKIDFAINHDSHNTFGGAAGQEGKIFVDDVFHWGNDWTDLLSWDIYPYLMKDFRYGPNRTLMKPRMSQMHFGMAQMRNVATAGQKKLGFYFGTYNPDWFDLTPEGTKQYWQSREMIMTAVGGGTDFLIAGLSVPIEATHWEDLGACLRTLQKASPAILKTKPVTAKAAMLFPRTQCIQTQEEYWNVGTSFEMFQRAFGELDAIHEEQVERDGLGDRKILVLFDVTLLPAKVIERIEAFVNAGGVVIADCVPVMNELRKPTDRMTTLFGVADAKTDRILWPVKMKPEIESDPKAIQLPKNTKPSDRLNGRAFEVNLDLPLVSPRGSTLAGGDALLNTASGQPGIVRRTVGKGRVYLLGFCVQDTTFEAYRSNHPEHVSQINDLLASITSDAGVTANIWSSNPDIEAALRVSDKDAFVVVVAHEPKEPAARVRVNALPFKVAKVVDVETEKTIDFEKDGETIDFDVSAPNGTSRLLHLLP